MKRNKFHDRKHRPSNRHRDALLFPNMPNAWPFNHMVHLTRRAWPDTPTPFADPHTMHDSEDTQG